jgi:hypothetical protein
VDRVTQTKRQRASGTARKAATTTRRRRDPLVKVEQERQVVQLWLAGASGEQIERATKLSRSTVYRIRKQAISASIEGRDKLRAELLERELMTIDALQASHWPNRADKDSATIILRCVAQRAKMLDLESPIRVDATVKSQLDEQIEQLVQELEGMGVPITTPTGSTA